MLRDVQARVCVAVVQARKKDAKKAEAVKQAGPEEGLAAMEADGSPGDENTVQEWRVVSCLACVQLC